MKSNYNSRLYSLLYRHQLKRTITELPIDYHYTKFNSISKIKILNYNSTFNGFILNAKFYFLTISSQSHRNKNPIPLWLCLFGAHARTRRQ